MANLRCLVGNNQSALVVPDSLNEFGQQALLDRAPDGIRLIPRPMAVARIWCEKHRKNYLGEGVKSSEGRPLGYLQILHFGMDCWELVLVPIHATEHKTKTYLIPVRNRRDDMLFELPYWGICLTMQLIGSLPINSAAGWRCLFADEGLQQRWWGENADNAMEPINTFLREGIGAKRRREMESWPIYRHLLDHNSDSLNSFESEIRKVYNSQKRNIKDLLCLGTIICGSFAELKYGNGIFAQHCAQIIQEINGDTTSPLHLRFNAAALGAHRLAQAISRNEPSYRDTLTPIDIHTRSTSATNDEIDDWIPLVEARTVEAGNDYVPESPITGLHIEAGEEALSLILRRRGLMDRFEHRRIRADLHQPTDRNEHVSINVRVRPGQGHARAQVTSVNPGIFQTMLNWKTMERCAAPPPPMLSYIPGVTRLYSTSRHFYACREYIARIVHAVDNQEVPDHGTLLDWIKELREGPKRKSQDEMVGMNKWPMRDSNPVRQEDFFKHTSLFGSDGSKEGAARSTLLDEFLDSLARLYKSFRLPPDKNSVKVRDALMRIGGWCYLAIPEQILKDIRLSFEQSTIDIKKVEVESAGLTFHSDEELKKFYSRLIQAIKKRRLNIHYGKEKPERGDANNNWWRSLRNIARFRERATHPEVITREDLDEVLQGVIEMLTIEVRKRKSDQLFSNGVKSTIYLMKRRRFEKSFLNNECEKRKQLQRLLERSRNYVGYTSAGTFVEFALKFLNKEATEQDLLGFLRSDKD
jgi:hypothetical protein